MTLTQFPLYAPAEMQWSLLSKPGLPRFFTKKIINVLFLNIILIDTHIIVIITYSRETDHKLQNNRKK